MQHEKYDRNKRRFGMCVVTIVMIMVCAACAMPDPTEQDFRRLRADFDRDERENAQQFQQGVRKTAEGMLEQIAGSFRTRTCAAASLSAEDARPQLNPLLQNELSQFSRGLLSSNIHSIFASRSLRNSEFGSEPISRATRDLVRDSVIDITSSTRPQASARGTRIAFSLGLVRALCRETDPSAGIARIRAGLTARPTDEVWGPLGTNIAQLGSVFDGWTQVAEAEKSFANAFFFILGHELSHVLLDSSSNALTTDQMEEVRADLLGLLAGEAMTGRYNEIASRERRLARTGKWGQMDFPTYITIISREGHRTLFELIYIKAGMVEEGALYLPFETRVRLLSSMGDELSDPRGG